MVILRLNLEFCINFMKFLNLGINTFLFHTWDLLSYVLVTILFMNSVFMNSFFLNNKFILLFEIYSTADLYAAIGCLFV